MIKLSKLVGSLGMLLALLSVAPCHPAIYQEPKIPKCMID